MISAGVRFGCVLADAGYGMSAPFRQGLTARKLAWAVGIPRHLKVYPVGVQLIWPITKVRGTGWAAPLLAGLRTYLPLSRTTLTQQLFGSAPQILATPPSGIANSARHRRLTGDFGVCCPECTPIVPVSHHLLHPLQSFAVARAIA